MLERNVKECPGGSRSQVLLGWAFLRLAFEVSPLQGAVLQPTIKAGEQGKGEDC